jgi:glycosyltransferase involved in cell wall biosynthesis
MNLLAMCITWNRPQLLGRSIHCFLQQTDPNARLFVLDDAGQYSSQEHDRWALFSTSKRYATMGQKRNALLNMALKQYPEVKGFMLWDDDDVYFPHTMECVSKALDSRCWAQPRLALEMNEDGRSLRRVETFSRNRPPAQHERSICYGGCWAWRLNTFIDLGRFPDTNHSEDIKVAFPCLERFGSSADSSPKEPWYYYNRLNNSISSEGKSFYAQRGRQKIEFVRELPIGWNGPNIFDLPIEPGVHPRPW